jgi:5'-3' exonuclease
MGIISFRSWLDNYYSKDVKSKNFPENIACLFIDMNSLIHGVTQRFYAYGDNMTDEEKNKQLKYLKTKTVLQLENECIIEICKEIFNTVLLIKPKEYIVLAVDGVAPMAKIAQQRKRRFKSKEIKPEEFDLEEEPDIVPVSSYFNSDCITPGTDFMMKLDENLKIFLYDNTKRRDAIFPKNVIYSSHLVPGEGEHKIFELLRAGEIEIQDKEAVNIINGGDADLAMLSMLCSEEICPNLFLWRNDIDKKTKKVVNDFFNIDAIRYNVHRDLIVNEELQQVITQKHSTRDFVFLIYLIGNDFVPSITTLTSNRIGRQTIDELINRYNELQLDLTKDSDPEDFVLIKEDNSINWTRFFKFMGLLSRFEPKYIQIMAASKYLYPFEALEKSIKISKVNVETNRRVIDIDYIKYRELYYSKVLSPISSFGKDFLMSEHIEGYPYTKNGIQEMVYQYLKGLQWIFQYYSTGTHGVSSRYVYGYHYAPLLLEIYELIGYFYENGEIPSLDMIIRKPDDPVITPIHQLMMVMHPKSWNLIPEPYRGLMPKRFTDISPYKFRVDKEGIINERSSHTAIPLIPFVDPERMILEIRDYPIPMIYREESNIFILTVQNARAPQIAISLKDAQKMYERENRPRFPKSSIEDSLNPDEVVISRKSKTKSLSKKYITSEEEPEDEEIIFTHHMTHSLNTPNRFAKKIKEEITIEEEKEQEEVLIKETFKRAKRPQWVTRMLM